MWLLSFSLHGSVPCGLFSMTRFLRLFVVGLLGSVGLACNSYAQTSPQSYWRTGSLNGATASATTPGTACERMYALASTASVMYTFDSAPAFDATSHRCFSTTNTDSVARHRGSASLAYCAASAPFYDDSVQRCVASAPPPPSCAKDNPGSGTWHAGKPGFPSPMQTGGCVGGCGVRMTEIVACYGPTGSFADYEAGQAVCTFKTMGTGNECSPGPGTPGTVPVPEDPSRMPEVPPSSPPPGSPCPKGTVQGGLDSAGTPICIGTGTAPQNSPPPPPKIESTQTQSTPDGGTVRTDTVKTQNSDGSTTTQTTTTTTAPDGTKTITITKDTSAARDGSSGADESDKEDDKHDLCKQNPMLTICRNSTVSGSCGSITCTGDAIQCATLRAAAAMQCKQAEDESALKASGLKTIGEAALNGSDRSNYPNPGNGQIVNIGGSMQESQGWLGAGAAFDDVTITIQGHAVVVPLSEWSGYLVSLRYVMMIIASLISFRILGTAILKE